MKAVVPTAVIEKEVHPSGGFTNDRVGPDLHDAFAYLRI